MCAAGWLTQSSRQMWCCPIITSKRRIRKLRKTVCKGTRLRLDPTRTWTENHEQRCTERASSDNQEGPPQTLHFRQSQITRSSPCAR
ncbi:hypothetical protein PBY51_011499 [Eleginops maclovinus]|uniref:Uncharacterized protein n=1 Tax=Eleginops maclovinus TaxID=56733 RepID=A0AAN7XNA3_ELEMC|nr:hypothetical protein PBY51_011499 [Eleginops maclovinus]